MTANAFLQLALYLVVLLALAKPLGGYMARVYDGPPLLLERAFGPLERACYCVAGVDPKQGMTWRTYTLAMLLFNFLGVLAVYALQRLQGVLPLNPQGLGAVSADSSFNTAVSFATNTNWQGYGGEATMSYLTQMLALTVQNFVSAAAGIATLIALIRGFALRQAEQIGNFWVDMVRSTLYVLLPLSLALALVLVSQGAVQNFDAYRTVPLLQATVDTDGQPVIEQMLAMGPAASQIAIKQLGTNGGGFFNVNSAHPFENPTPLSNFLEMLSILLIPARSATPSARWSATRARVGRARRHDGIFVALLALCVCAEYAATRGSPLASTAASALAPAATWRARRCASASPTPRCGQRPRPPPPTARSTRCTTPSRRSAGSCRCA
jgi:K+-transporting ATPase ATPase A chain